MPSKTIVRPLHRNSIVQNLMHRTTLDSAISSEPAHRAAAAAKSARASLMPGETIVRPPNRNSMVQNMVHRTTRQRHFIPYPRANASRSPCSQVRKSITHARQKPNPPTSEKFQIQKPRNALYDSRVSTVCSRTASAMTSFSWACGAKGSVGPSASA